MVIGGGVAAVSFSLRSPSLSNLFSQKCALVRTNSAKFQHVKNASNSQIFPFFLFCSNISLMHLLNYRDLGCLILHPFPDGINFVNNIRFGVQTWKSLLRLDALLT